MRFLTLYKSDVVTDAYWKDLAATDDTLVFYMSSETLDEVVQKLSINNISSDKLLAVVEQATTPLQHVHVSSFDNYNENMRGQRFISPSIVIIGKVVALHEQFAWLPNSNSKEYYFKPMGSLLNTTNTTDNAKANVSRA